MEINKNEVTSEKIERSRRNPGERLNQEKYDGSTASSKGSSFEKAGTFREGFSSYLLTNRKFTSKKAGLLSNDFGGMPLDWNKKENVVYVDSRDSHTVVIGSTGAMKSRLVAMPSVHILGSAGESMIICDPKAEIYNRTAAVLSKQGYDISVINLRNPEKGSAWNPLYIPYSFYINDEIDHAYEFVNDIAVNLMLSEITAKDPYWDYSACNLFFGLALLLFKLCKQNNLPPEYANMRNLLALRQEMFEGEDKYDIQRSDIWEYAETDNIIASNLRGIVVTPDRTMSCILSTFDQKMRCFMLQPSLVDMLSHHTISLKTIGEKKTAIYLIMPDEKTSYHKLITIFIKQSYEYMIYNAQRNGDSKMPVRVNYVLDEFSSLPYMQDFPTMVTAARSRNIRFTLLIQSKHQLLQRYNEETETILSNCMNWIFLTSREVSLLRDISELCGRDRSNKDLVTIPFLQHMNKEEGEALILSGRMFPYKAHLADIDFYDGGEYEILPFEQNDFSNNNCIISSFSEYICTTDKPADKEQNSDCTKENYNIQKELEKKFDELFGKQNEESSDADDKKDSKNTNNKSTAENSEQSEVKQKSARMERKKKRKE